MIFIWYPYYMNNDAHTDNDYHVLVVPQFYYIIIIMLLVEI